MPRRTTADLATIDRALTSKGFPPLSPFWRETFGQFLQATKRQLVCRVGRRGGKSSELASRGLRFEEWPWSAPSKTDAVHRLRQLIRDELLVIDPTRKDEVPNLIGEAETFTQKITPSGALSFGARGRAHDDRIMTLLLAARVDAEGRLTGSPISTLSTKTEIYDYDVDAYDDMAA